MTTANTTGLPKTPEAPSAFRFPDPPEKEPDDMTSFDHLAATGNVRYLALHLGNFETTLVAGEHYLSKKVPHLDNGHGDNGEERHQHDVDVN